MKTSLGLGRNPEAPAAIAAAGLEKRFGTVVALDGVDLAVPECSVLALLGHNGAGKTTLVRILATLIRPDRGRAQVAGWDTVTERDNVRCSIGLTGQFVALDSSLTGRENLTLIGRLGGIGADTAKSRAAELLETLGLTQAADRRTHGYSGGMRRRLDLAASLMTRPKVLFLDEPTTGLDPASRLRLWELVEGLRAEGTTVLLTTQYLEEADRLADEICVLNAGRVISRGTASELKSRHGGHVVEVSLLWPRDTLIAAQSIAGALRVPFEAVLADTERAKIVTPAHEGASALTRAIEALSSNRIDIQGAAFRPPTLDEVFLTLTGGDPAAEVDEPCRANGAAL